MIFNRLIKENSRTPSLIPPLLYLSLAIYMSYRRSVSLPVLLAFAALNRTFHIIYIRFFSFNIQNDRTYTLNNR